MIKIKTFQSGSSGNLHLITSGDRRLLIECGLSLKKIKEHLDFDLGVDGCLLSHYHKDHAKSAVELMMAGVDLYCTQPTADCLNLSGHRLKIVGGRYFNVNGFRCLSFAMNHDTPGAVGFLISVNGERILFATDTGTLPYKIPGLTYIMIECNHSDETMGDENQAHIARVQETHLSLDSCLGFLKNNDLSKIKQIHLLHLSDSNSDAAYFRERVQAMTGKEVIV